MNETEKLIAEVEHRLSYTRHAESKSDGDLLRRCISVLRENRQRAEKAEAELAALMAESYEIGTRGARL